MWFCISFADDTEGYHLGTTIVQADSMVGALRRTIELGISPDNCEAVVAAIAGEVPNAGRWMIDRLCSKEEMDQHGGVLTNEEIDAAMKRTLN